MAAPAEKRTSLDERLDVIAMPEGGWSQTARVDALARVRASGLPDRRDEYWKYTRPDTLVQAVAPSAAVFDVEEAPVFGTVDRLKIVFVDGVYDADASDDLTLEGVRIERLADTSADIHWARDLYGTLEKKRANAGVASIGVPQHSLCHRRGAAACHRSCQQADRIDLLARIRNIGRDLAPCGQSGCRCVCDCSGKRTSGCAI